MGVLDQVRSRIDMMTRGAPGAGRRPGDPKISDFIGDQQGVDSLTTSTITMLHSKDTVTLVNSYDGVTANFKIKFVVNVKVKTFWWTAAEKTEEYVEKFSLSVGESKTVTLDEGALIDMGIYGVIKNVDIYIELISVDGWDPTGREETTYVAPGEMVFGEGGYWNPQNVISRVRKRRMVIGPLSNGKGRRRGLISMVQKGKVYSPKQAAMIYGADTIEDAAEMFNLGLRPY